VNPDYLSLFADSGKKAFIEVSGKNYHF